MNGKIVLQSSAKRQLRAILSKPSETIRPSSPTPPNLKRYNLSTRDIFTPNIYIPLVLFFPNATGSSLITNSIKAQRNMISCHLKRSLSKTLAQFYPFAGRLMSGSYVHCNDEGAHFFQARFECDMSDILEKGAFHNDKEDDNHNIGILFPPGSVWGELNKNITFSFTQEESHSPKKCIVPEKESSPLVIVQLNHFECGGIAMAVSISHRITDGCGVCSFVAHWAAVSSGQLSASHRPHFISWPSYDSIEVPQFHFPNFKNRVTRKFVFPNSSLATLKTNIANKGIENPTRVQVLTALLYKSAIAASAAANSAFTPSVLIQPANMRSTLKNVPETSVGNFYWPYFVRVRKESEATLYGLNEQIKRGKTELGRMELKDMDGKVLGSKVVEDIRENYKTYVCSSLCNFPLRKVDFGWGRPIKMSFGDGISSNVFYLMDTPSGDGIEASVSLDEQEMVRFQRDEQILNYCCCC